MNKLPIKITYLWLLIGILFFSMIVVYAATADYLKIDKGATVTGFQAADGFEYSITNTSKDAGDKSYFVPNKTQAEWDAFKNAADTYLNDIEVVPVK